MGIIAFFKKRKAVYTSSSQRSPLEGEQRGDLLFYVEMHCERILLGVRLPFSIHIIAVRIAKLGKVGPIVHHTVTQLIVSCSERTTTVLQCFEDKPQL